MTKKKIFKALMMSLLIPSITHGQTGPWNVSGTTVLTETSKDVKTGRNISMDGAGDGHHALRAFTTNNFFGLYAHSASNNGPAIEMYGTNSGSFKGRIQYTTFNTTPTTAQPVHEFQNFNGSTWASLFRITNQGNLETGSNISMNNMGDDNHTIRSYSTNGLLGLYANSTSNNGATIEMYGANSGFKGQLHYTSYLDNPSRIGHEFSNWNNTTWMPLMRIMNDGRVVVSDNDPATMTDKLTVENNIGFVSDNDGGRQIKGHAVNGYLGMYANGTSQSDGGSNIELYGQNSGYPGSVAYNSYGFTGNGHIFQCYGFVSGSPQWRTNMVIQNDGKVVIGSGIINQVPSKTPGNYKLYVEQGILTEKLRVANKTDDANWADFVFDKNYDLMPLHKVEEFIQENKHLPEIPSAEEVAKDGIDVMQMDSKLLQKIEELTLYVIKQQKEIEQLKKHIGNK